jgi:hypothetical protein
MDADLQPVYDRVMSARRSEDVFKELTVLLPPRLLVDHLASEMTEMRTILTEDHYSSVDDRALAREARERLEALYQTALERCARGLYVLDDFTMLLPSTGRKIIVNDSMYYIGEKFHVGEHSALYKGRLNIDGGSAGVVIRVANTPDDNPFLFNEIRNLDVLHRHDVGHWRYLPYILDRFTTSDRVGIIYRYFEGVTLSDIRSDPLHKDGLDQRHVVWVMDRLLNLLGYAHSVGITHGRIEPEKIRVRPSNHNALITGWGHAVLNPQTSGESIYALGGVFEAPEIAKSGPIGPWTDIYALGKTLIWLIGGDPKTNVMPESVHPKIRQFLLNMVPKNPKARPRSAWQLYEAQNRLKDSLWERRFLHLNLSRR